MSRGCWAVAAALVILTIAPAKSSENDSVLPLESVSDIAAPLTAIEARATAEAFLLERLPVWQKRLNLQEWKVTVVITPRSGLKSETLGGIRWDKKKRVATMAVMDPSDYKVAFSEVLKDLEFTLVHELIHLELASLPRSEASRSTEEQAVNNLTRALLASSVELQARR